MTLRCLRDGLPGAMPFTVSQLPCHAKLDQNEAPGDLPDPLKRELAAELAAAAWHRYPQPARYVDARRRFAGALGLDPESLFLCVGGDQAILSAFHLAGGSGRRARWFEPTYPYIALAAQVTQTTAEPVCLPAAPEHAAAAASLLAEPAPSLVVLVSPNNPTGGCIPRSVLDTALADERRLVFLDEAYADFAGGSLLAEVSRHPNLAIGRSLSKALLAGARLGYVVAHPEAVRALEAAFAAPYHLNVLQLLLAARFDLIQPHLAAMVRSVVAERERMFAELARVSGLSPRPSHANFLLFQVAGDPAGARRLHRELAESGIRVRDVGGLPTLAGHLRVTVGRPEENDAFLAAIRDWGARHPASPSTGPAPDR